MMKKTWMSVSALILVAPLDAKPLEVDDKARSDASHGLGYLKGRELVNELKKSGFTAEDFAAAGLLKGFEEAFRETDSSVKTDDFNLSLELLKVRLKQRELNLAKWNLAKSEDWLKKIAKADSEVESTDSGLHYKVIKKGYGKKYENFDGVKDEKLTFFINYEASLPDGTVFERVPAEKAVAVKLNGLAGISEALKRMPSGATWELYLKPGLAYGARRLSAKVEPNSCVIFKLSLIKMAKDEEQPVAK